MRTLCGGLASDIVPTLAVVGLLFCRTCGAQEGAATTGRGSQEAATRLKHLQADYDAGIEEIRKEMLQTRTEEQVNDTLWSDGPLERLAHFGPQFVTLAQNNARTDVAWKALTFVVYVRGFSGRDKGIALDQMLRDHVDEDRFVADLYFHLFRPGVDKEQFYSAVLNHRNMPRRVAGLARYAFGKWLSGRKDKSCETKALELFRQVVNDYADLPHPYDEQRGSLGDAARRAAFEIEHLQIGKQAPEIAGEDVDGREFRLSDFRGTVVLLVFCGDWCGPCRSMYPHEKELLERLQKQPFAIVGVNSDEPTKLREAINREKFPFRWFADGSPRGPISSQWNVEFWPMIYILDRTGTIRLKRIGAPAKSEEIDGVIEQLLVESG
ncbi:MAG TPA: peroxiredoxin family protein [Pirellulales bacterium]|nr:peroxiredoxin family protein [Pirellulales bacterium]